MSKIIDINGGSIPIKRWSPKDFGLVTFNQEKENFNQFSSEIIEIIPSTEPARPESELKLEIVGFHANPHDFEELIRKFQCDDSADSKTFTHFYIPNMTYLSIPQNEMASFWVNYCSLVKNGCNPQLCEYVGNKDMRQLRFNLKIIF